MIEFVSPVFAGTVLVREAIQSQNYVPGVSGWILYADGTFELAGGTFRGDVIVTAVDGSFVKILSTDGGKIQIQPEDAVGVTYLDVAELFAGYAPAAGGFTFMTLNTAAIDDSGATPQRGQLFISSALGDGTARSGFTQTGPTADFNGSLRVQGEILVENDITNETDGMEYLRGQNAKILVTFAASTSVTVAVNFPIAFPVGVVPVVQMNINSNAGNTRYWRANAINVTNTGFTAWYATTDAARAAEAWTNEPVSWTATVPT